jgi:hypothetical protein
MVNITPPVKTWKVRPQGDLASVRVSEDWVSLASSKEKNFITVDAGGISMGGKLSYQGLPNQITFGGLLTFPFFPLLFLPVGPTMVPSPDIPLLLVSFAKLGKTLAPLLG